MAYYGINLSKGVLHIDDALDVHWVHGATGAVGVCVSKETYYSVKRDLLQHTALQAQQVSVCECSELNPNLIKLSKGFLDIDDALRGLCV